MPILPENAKCKLEGIACISGNHQFVPGEFCRVGLEVFCHCCVYLTEHLCWCTDINQNLYHKISNLLSYAKLCIGFRSKE